MPQDQFLNVVDRDEAERRFHAALHLEPRAEEVVSIEQSLSRVLSRDVVARVDVPSFDRSNFDGYAVRAADTFGASEEHPRRLRLRDEVIATAVVPQIEVEAGTATTIATGGMLPRGADAILMVEHADECDAAREVLVRRAVSSGSGIAFAGSDILAGETVLRRGDLLTSRETGVLAAIGESQVPVWRRPHVAILSTGNEIISPGQPMRPGLVYDSNARILADAVWELGAIPKELGIVSDDIHVLRASIADALESCDVVLLSGGTSKGAGDLSYRVVREFNDPGIVAHGVALKPGKPICLAVTQGKPVVILPGFPTSAIFTFHEFVAPVIRRLAGLPPADHGTVPARLAMKVNSEIGRTEYLLVGLVESPQFAATDSSTTPPLTAYPMGKGSGSVTTFSHADGFVTIGRHEEIVEAGQAVNVRLMGREWRPADLVAIGSHCIGFDFLLSQLRRRGFHTKFLAVGSTAGLEAAKRGECDVAGIHLLDPVTLEYNRPFLTPDLELIPGYRRWQGIVFRRGDSRFEDQSVEQVLARVNQDAECRMINRNQGSGTRLLIDRLLGGAQPAGYALQPRSHNAVAIAVAQSRADWGVAIRSVATPETLGFLPLAEEQYDFMVPRSRTSRPAVLALRELLIDLQVRVELRKRALQT